MTTEVETHQAALIADPEDNSMSILIPATPTDIMPTAFVFLCACAARYESDPAWAESMIDWFMDVHSNKLH